MGESSAARVIIAVIPIVGIVAGAFVIFSYLLWSHHRQMALIKSGQWKPVHFNISMFSLLTGLLLTIVGIVLTIFFALLRGLDWALLGGIIPLALGIAFLVFFTVDYCLRKGKSHGSP
jgi:hypothetical protein